jgi:pantetheine-phosphate adenylyltransferase
MFLAKKIKTALYAGTFDPFTNGHDDILRRALKIFDHITVLIAVSPTKRPMFSSEDRQAMIEEHYKNNKKISVDSWEGLIVEYARQKEIGAILRGLRPTGDFEVEFQMASMNGHLFPEVETVFLPTSGENYFISSSLVKEVHSHGGDIDKFVPPAMLKYLKEAKS